MAYTTKDLEKQKKQQGISKDKLSYAVAQGGNAAALAGGMAKQGINAAKQVGYGIGTIKTLLNKPKDYEESDEVKQAQENLKNHYNSKPGDYQSNYADQIQGLLKDYENTKDFQYDFNADPLYQQYKDQYIQQGKMAMQDTMGNAAALTGGYGSSYASTAGNQAYQSSLNDLNNVIPSLYDRAYSKYRDDKSDKLQHMQVLQNLDDSDYKKYQDTLSDYYNTLNYLQSQSQYLSESDYNRYLNQLAQWQYELEYYTGRADAAQQQSNWQSEQNRQYMQDYVNQRNWQKQFDYGKQQDSRDYNLKKQQFEHDKYMDSLKAQSYSTSSSSSSGGSGYSGSSSGSGGKQTATTKKQNLNGVAKASIFIGKQPTEEEYNPATHGMMPYDDYIRKQMAMDRSLSDEDIHAIAIYYGLQF